MKLESRPSPAPVSAARERAISVFPTPIRCPISRRPSPASRTGRRALRLYLPVGNSSRPLDADPVDDNAHDVRGQLLSVAAARHGLTTGPGVHEVEERLSRERRVHLPQLAGAHTLVKDLLHRREEVAEEGT